MATDTEQKAVPPWYLRGKTLIIGAGALAAASLAILGLWDRLFPQDLADVAKVESVDLLRESTLHEFTSIGTEFPLTPTPGDAAGRLTLEHVAATIPTNPVVPLEPPSDPLAPSTPGTPDVPTEAPSDGPSISPTTAPPSATETPTEPTATVDPGRLLPSQDYLASVMTDPVLEAFIPEDVRKVAYVQIGPTGTGGEEELPPDELADRLFEALSAVEATEVGGKSDPRGWTVAVSLRLEGLSGVPLLLTWSLDGGDVPVTWSADNVAYRVVPETPDDTGSAEIWVPDLEAPGAYRVNVKLYRESNLAPIAHGTPLEITDQ